MVEVRKRNDLFALLRERRLNDGNAVEIGVAEGGFSFYLADCCPKMTVYQVDPWTALSDDEYHDYNNVAQEEQDRRYKLVCDTAQEYTGRVQVIRKFSEDAVSDFPNSFFDFIYLDANHKLEFIRKDIMLWWPKAKKGSIFAGHDYLDGIIKSGEYGVKTAVDEFVARHKLKLHLTKEKDYPSWWIVK